MTDTQPARGPSKLALGFAFSLPFLVAAGLLIYNEVSTGCTPLNDDTIGKKVFASEPCQITDEELVYFAEFRTTAGPIRIGLDPILAPRAVNALVFLIKAGFYDGIRIHRVDVTPDHAIVQFGDPTGTGRGGAGFTFESDTPSPVTRYTRGTAAMVFAGEDPATASSQFFIVVSDYDELSYPARQPINTLLGGVIDDETMDTLDTIVALPLDGTRPVADLRIIHASVAEQRRFGEDEEPTPTPSPSPSPSPTPEPTGTKEPDERQMLE